MTLLRDQKILTALLVALIFCGLMMVWGPRQSLDTKFYYTGEQAKAFFGDLSLSEKEKYALNEYFDLGLILAYTAAMFFGFKKVWPRRKIQFLAFLPGTLDLLETVFIILILKGSFNLQSLSWLGWVTTLKWSSGFVVTAMLFIKTRADSTRV